MRKEDTQRLMIAFYQRNENLMLPGKQLNKVSSVFNASLISL